MSTNHNRIRVADLETNQPNKILKTNLNGELEFSDVSNLQAESYNALDCTTEGKILDARQGKVLKDMIDNKNVNISTDQETQITTSVTEDNKVVSRLKLFNWWQWVKSQTQTISGAWNFTNKVTLAAGNTTTPSLIIPSGTLTNSLYNGAMERDPKGELYQVINNKRYRIVDDRDFNNFLTTSWRSSQVNSVSISSTYTNNTSSRAFSIPTNALGAYDSGNYLFKTFDQYIIKNGIYAPSLQKPTSIIFELYLKGNNCKFSGNQYIKLYSLVRTDVDTASSLRSYEIPIAISSIISSTTGSQIMFPEKVFDNLGNTVSETIKEYYLQSSSYTGKVANMNFKDASLSLECRVSVAYSDGSNVNAQNVDARPIYFNYSSMFLKL